MFTYRQGRGHQTIKQEERGTAATGGEFEVITSILLFSRSAPLLTSPALMGSSTARTRLEAGRAWKVILMNMKRNLSHVRAWLSRAGRSHAVSAWVLRFHLAPVFVCCCCCCCCLRLRVKSRKSMKSISSSLAQRRSTFRLFRQIYKSRAI